MADTCRRHLPNWLTCEKRGGENKKEERLAGKNWLVAKQKSKKRRRKTELKLPEHPSEEKGGKKNVGARKGEEKKRKKTE